MAKNPLKVTRLRIYPVKALEGMDVETWELDASGLRLDRRWMVVDASGQCVTRREYPGLAAVRAEIAGDRLVLTAPHEASLELPADPEAGPTDPATIRGEALAVREVSEDANRWLSQWLKAAVRLVYLQESRLREVDPSLGTRKSALAFQDELPLQIVGAGSLKDLNGRIAAALKVEDVRPNLLIEGVSPYEEDTWRRIRVGDVEIQIVKPWPRYALVRADSEAAGAAALAALGDRTRNGVACFGQLAMPKTSAGQLRLGDAVEVLERGEPPVFGEAGAAVEDDLPLLEELDEGTESEAADPSGAGEGKGKKVRLVSLPARRKPKAPDPGEVPDPWAAPVAEEDTKSKEAPAPDAPAEEPAADEVAAEEVAAEEVAAEVVPADEVVGDEVAAEEAAVVAAEGAAEVAADEPPAEEVAAPETELPVEQAALEEPAAESAAAVEIEVATDRVPELDETVRLLAAAAVSEGKGATKRLAEACLAAPVLVTAWKGEALVGLLRGWTDEVRDGFIADVAVHPDQHGSGAAQALVERVVATYPDIRWVLRASPGSAYLGSALEWQHAGSGWYLSPR